MTDAQADKITPGLERTLEHFKEVGEAEFAVFWRSWLGRKL